MKHLHLAAGLLISALLAGCGDYGDDGAVYRTGAGAQSSTDFNLAVAVPQFDGVSGKLQRKTTSARAVTGSAPFTELTEADVRAYVVVPDDSNTAGYREVPVEVVEFEALGNGRYRIAIDGQAQVDGFFAVTINGIEFRIPMSRTGTTDEPIDVNALLAALADRLQSLLVADQVCDTLSIDQLNTILDQGQSYIASLTVPDDISTLDALVGYYRVASASFMQTAITQACAPALDSLAVAAVPGTYHSLQSGVAAYVDDLSAQATTYIAQFVTQSSVDRVLDSVDATQVLQNASVERDDRYAVEYAAGGKGSNGVLTNYSVLFPDIGLQQSTASLVSFATDASRAALQFAEVIDVEPDTGARGFVPGFMVAKTPAYQLSPQGGSLFGASQTTKFYFDASQASAGCLTSLGLTSAQLADAQAFPAAAQAAIDAAGDDATFASRLQADCGGAAPVAFDTNLHVETQAIAASTPLAVSDLEGRYALVGLEWTQQLSGATATSGYEGSSVDLLFDIDVEGGMTQRARSQARVFQPASAALGGVDSSALDGDSFSLQLAVNQQTTLTDGQVQLNALSTDGSLDSYTGFVSAAPHNLMALNLSSLSDGGGKVGGYVIVGRLPAVQDAGVTLSGTLALVFGINGISAVDVSNPQSLQLISTLTSITDAQSIAVDGNGNYAFVATGSSGLRIIDISNPAAMTVVGSGPYYASATTTRVALVLDGQGNAVLALTGEYNVSSSVLRAIRVSSPAAPVELGSYDLGTNYIYSVAVAGGAALVGSYAQLFVLDLAEFFDSDTASNNFTLVPNTLQIASTIRHINVVGSTAYLAADLGGIYLLNVTDVANISQISTLNVSDYAERISVDGNRAYVALTNEGYTATAVVDLTNPASPQKIAVLPASGDNAVANGYLLIATGDPLGGLVSVDTATPGPQQIASIAGLNSSPIVTVAGTTAYQVNATDGFSTHDISNPASPVALDTLDTAALGGAPSGVTVSGNYAYIITTAQSLVIVDVTDPANLSVIGTPVTLTGYPSAVTAFSQGASQYVAVAAGASLDLIDVTTPAAPTPAPSVSIGDSLYDVAVSADGLTAFVAGYNTVWIVNMTSIGNAVVSGTVSGVTDVRGVEFDGSYIYASTFYNGLQVIDAGNLTVVGSYYDLQYLYGLRLDGSTAYLLGAYGVTVVDVSNPASLRPLGFVSLPSLGTSIEVTGQYLLAQGYDSSLQTAPYSVDIYQLATTVRAAGGIALGVRLPLPPTTLTDADLVGHTYALAGQQTEQTNIPSPSTHAGFSALAAGSLRFVSVSGEVYPIVDLPLAGMVVSDFSGVLPKLEIRFEQWQAGPVDIDTNGRWSFTLTSGGDTATFAGYVGADGTLVGHATLFVPDTARPPVVDGSDTVYAGLVEASQLLFVGVLQ